MDRPLLNAEAAYEALPGDDQWRAANGEAPAVNGHGDASPDLLESGEVEWGAMPNLDLFFERVYRYYQEKGFWVIVTARVLNLLALGFTAAFSGFLLLWVDWSALRAECIQQDTCDILEMAVLRHPLQHGAPLWSAARIAYLMLLAAYWAWSLVHLIVDLKSLAEVRHFCNARLGLSERAMQTVTWPEVARRIVDVQRNLRLCIKRDLTEHDIVSRIMRKDNYLIGMLNKGVLALNVPLLGARRFMLTKTLEWNLRWGVLDHMLDDSTFCIRPEFVSHPEILEQRLRRLAWANLVLAPFVFVSLAIHFFLRNAEQLYHHPSSVGARRWSPLARWRLREFNELPHYIDHRLNASHEAAEQYIGQFPSPMLSHAARFVAFIAGSFAALLLGVALVDDQLLERRLSGRTLVWWAATLGVVLAVSRAFIIDPATTAFHPELAMLEVVAHTHHMPRHWRGRAHTREVQGAFQELFQFKAALLAEEMLSILATPFVLYFSLPRCANAIAAFVRDNTVHVEGIGDVCSLATFDLARHGNPRYGSPLACPKAARSRQGKVEKSLLSFATTYPGWEPGAAAKQMLSGLRNAGPPVGFDAAGAGGWPAGAPPGPHYPYTMHLGSADKAGGVLSRFSAMQHGAPLPPPSTMQPAGPGGRPRRSIFASAEMAAAASAVPHLPTWASTAAGGSVPSQAPSGVTGWVKAATVAHASHLDVEEHVAASHLLLQSFYEEHEDAAVRAEEERLLSQQRAQQAQQAQQQQGQQRPWQAAAEGSGGSSAQTRLQSADSGDGGHLYEGGAVNGGSVLTPGWQSSSGTAAADGHSHFGQPPAMLSPRTWARSGSGSSGSGGRLAAPAGSSFSSAPGATHFAGGATHFGGAMQFGESVQFGGSAELGHAYGGPQAPALMSSASLGGGEMMPPTLPSNAEDPAMQTPLLQQPQLGGGTSSAAWNATGLHPLRPADPPPAAGVRRWLASPRACGRSGGNTPSGRQLDNEMAYLGTSPAGSSGGGLLQ